MSLINGKITSYLLTGTKGFTVERIGRFAIEYREPDNVLTIGVEPGHDGVRSCLIVERNSFERWDGDPSYITLPLEKQEEIVTNFIDAMEIQHLRVIVDESKDIHSTRPHV